MTVQGEKIHPRAVIAKAKGDDLSEIERLAAKYTPGLTKAILSYLEAMQGSVDLQALAEAIKTGSIEKVIALLAGATDAAAEATTNALQDAVWGGAALGAGAINLQLSGAHFAFDRLNPRLIDWLKSYSFNLIRQINDGTKEAIREKLVTGMNAGDNPIKTAREVRGAIGLTTRQQKAVANYRKELETFHLKRTAGGYNLGQPIDRVNGRQVYRPGEDGLPMDGITERRLRDFRYDGQLKTAVTTGKPLKPAQIDKMVAAYERKYLRHRSETIARTEALRATNYGVQDAWRQAIETGKANETLVRRLWIVTKDERRCEVCGPIPGMNPKRGVQFGQPFATLKGPVMMPPIHPNCLPAGALVSTGSGISAASRRWYEGEIVVLRTASGKELAATVNHPILTVEGWKAAGLIHEGGNVICRAGVETVTAKGSHHENVPAPIEEVAGAFLKAVEVTAREVPVAPEDFHGDGAGSEVAVVGAKLHLRDARDAALGQHAHKDGFQVALGAGEGRCASCGDLLPMLSRMLHAAHGLMGSTHLSGALGGVHASPLDRLGAGLVAQLDARAGQGSGDGGAADAKLAAQIIDGSTGEVFADEVVEVRRVPFSGHVYNLETGDSHYTANGLVSHNCRCTLSIRQWEPSQLGL